MSAGKTEAFVAAPSGRALAGFAGWTALARIVAQGAQFAGFVFAARVLGPADFGLFSLVLVSSTLLMVVASAGWYERLLSTEGERPFLHAISLIAGATSGLLILLGGFVASSAFGIPEIAQLCVFFAISMPLLTIGRLHGAVLVADNRIGRNAFVQIAMELAALVALIVALQEGMGLLSLGVSKLVHAVVGWGLAVWSTRWFAMAVPNRDQLADILRFSRNMLAGSLTFFLQENLSILLIGAFLGPAGAGLYRAGARVAGAVAEVLGEATRMIAWTTLRAARAEGDGPEVFITPVLKLIGYVAIFTLPAFVGLIIVAQDLTHVLLGPEWLPTAWVIALLALRRIPLSVENIAFPLLILRDAASMVPKIALASASVSVLALVVAAPHGLIWAAAGQLAAGLAIAPLNFWVLIHYAKLGWRGTLSATAPALLGLSALFGTTFMVQSVFFTDSEASYLRLVTTVFSGSAIYCISIFVFMKIMKTRAKTFI